MFDLSNPYKTAIHKYAQQLLGDKYNKYAVTVQRATTSMVTNEDATNFSKFMLELYEAGFLKAVADYKKIVEAHGVKVVIKPEKS